MYSANNNPETVDLTKLEKMGMNIFTKTKGAKGGRITNDSAVVLSVQYDKRFIRISVAKNVFETFLNQDRFSFAVDRARRRMYFVPHESGYKFSAGSKNARYTTRISGSLFDELRYVKGTITGIDKKPERDLLYDKSVGLHYINLVVDEEA
jgi:hypothetical protein